MRGKLIAIIICAILVCGCRGRTNSLSADLKKIDLKRGNIISCGPADQKFGTVNFAITASPAIQEKFNLGLALLHSFEYDESEKVFTGIMDEEPHCAMAYWGVAMSNYHPLWMPPSEEELKKGAALIKLAKKIKGITKKETDYINAIGIFYDNYATTDHRSRCLAYEKAMEQLYNNYPGDKEAAIFYALALDAAADPADKTFSLQKKAGQILYSLYPGEPDHPGIAHYIIHTYDYPELAHLALPTARKYASIAPSSAHALHMPSHTFTMLGLWDECISSNQKMVESAQCYAETSKLPGHWDEEMHGQDYLVYAYLQKGDNASALKQWNYIKTIKNVTPPNFKVAYAFAAIPSRYTLENKLWTEAAELEVVPSFIDWKKFPWQEAIIHFAKAMGYLNSSQPAKAKNEISILDQLGNQLRTQKDEYKANQVQIQAMTAKAWLLLREGKKEEAIRQMKEAADMEDRTEKHPVTPCEVIPAMELLGDMYTELNLHDEALVAYEASLKRSPNRFNGLYGAGSAAEKTGNTEKASHYFRTLLQIAGTTKVSRPEWKKVWQYRMQ